MLQRQVIYIFNLEYDLMANQVSLPEYETYGEANTAVKNLLANGNTDLETHIQAIKALGYWPNGFHVKKAAEKPILTLQFARTGD